MKRTDILITLALIEDQLSDDISDAQDKAEADPEFESHHKYDDGKPFCVPEDAAPELDDVRGHIRDAIEILREMREEA